MFGCKTCLVTCFFCGILYVFFTNSKNLPVGDAVASSIDGNAADGNLDK